jgi:hypothetical protein
MYGDKKLVSELVNQLVIYCCASARSVEETNVTDPS